MVIPTLIPARLLCYLMSWAENAKRGCRFQLPSLDDWVPGSHSGPPPGTTVKSETVDLHGPETALDFSRPNRTALSAHSETSDRHSGWDAGIQMPGMVDLQGSTMPGSASV